MTMAKNKLEEKVEKLASNKVDTFIKHNENKKTTGRNVRPVIESWVDELEDIASSTDKEEAPEEDFQRIRKAANTLKNILKSKDDELTYFMMNAPKRFWETLRYVFDDTFTQRNYDPQPLTKYEVPGYAPQRMGLKPSRTPNEEVGSNIPDKPKVVIHRVPKDNVPRFDKNELMRSRSEEEARKKKEAEEKEAKEREAKEKEELESQQEKDKREFESNPSAYSFSLFLRSLNDLKNKVPVEVNAEQKKEEYKRPLGFNNPSEVTKDYKAFYGKVNKILSGMLTSEIDISKGMAENGLPTVLVSITGVCDKIGEKLKEFNGNIISRNEALFKNNILPLLSDLIEFKGRVEAIRPHKVKDFYTKEMDEAVDIIQQNYNNMITVNEVPDNSNFKMSDVLSEFPKNIEAIFSYSKILISLDSAFKQDSANRIAVLSQVKASYSIAAQSGDPSDIKIDLFDNATDIDKIDNSEIIKAINVYMKNTIKTLSYNRTKILVNAIKRLNGYVR